MRKSQRRFLALSVSILGVLTLAPCLAGQSANVTTAGPLITDWSFHHVIFSQPTEETLERVQNDVRYRQQVSRRLAARVAETSPPQLDFPRSLAGKEQTLGGDWSEDMGSGAKVGATNYPAKYSFKSTTASCSNDFVVYGTGLTGGTNQANIVAFNNLYSGCTGTVPSVYWAFNTGGGTTVTSPVFSRDGTQVAFVQTGGGFPSTLVILKWAPSTTETITSPMTLTFTPHSSYPSCVAPCFTIVALRNSGSTFEKDSNSSVFYDYSHDSAYVGDDAGYLHQITPVFLGVPGPVLTGGWPILVNPTAATALTSPVKDDASGNIFVADTGGFLYLVDPTTAAVTTSGQLDFSTEFDGGPGIVQGPIVDSASGFVYVFATSDGSLSCIGGADCSAVYQLTTTFTSGSTGSEAVVGASSVEPTVPNPLYLGAFDSTYENSLNATGNLYVCGNTGGSPILYQVPIAAGSLGGTGNPGPVLSTSLSTPCSPVSDIYNPNTTGGATEWIFASAENGGITSGCASGGCIFNFKDTPWQPLTVYSNGQQVLDSHFQIQVAVTVTGTSGGSAPTWQTAPGKITTDGGVHWIDQGVQSAATLPGWAMATVYTKNVSKILDPNGDVEVVTAYTTHSATCTSGGTIPSFSTTPGITTTDNTCIWTNAGTVATAAMPAAGGTSGIIMDNTVSSGTQAGASQVYFSTLSDQACGTTGTGGCAVQASQSALH